MQHLILDFVFCLEDVLESMWLDYGEFGQCMIVHLSIYLPDDAFGVGAKRFNNIFTSILALFFLLRIANNPHFYAPDLKTFK